MTVFYLVQHGEKKQQPGDPGLTELGRQQAGRTAQWLRQAGLSAVFSSPARRARETADLISSAAGVAVREDIRLRERMNWDGTQPIGEFLAEWASTVRDRSLVPLAGDSSWQAGERVPCLPARQGSGARADRGVHPWRRHLGPAADAAR
jgi:broad specificity phosphatase PhoE